MAHLKAGSGNANEHFGGAKSVANYEQAVGKIVRITQRVDDLAQTGKGILDGMEWTVRTDGKEVLEKDTLARVIRISGVKLIVEPYKED